MSSLLLISLLAHMKEIAQYLLRHLKLPCHDLKFFRSKVLQFAIPYIVFQDPPQKSLILARLSISRTNCSRDSTVAGIKQFEMKPKTFKTAFFSVFSASLAFCPNAPVLRGVVIAGF